jgi:hypothetical protein
MQTLNNLAEAIRDVLPEVIKEINEIRIPALEQAWGRSFADELANENQVTVEIAKNYARPVNNTFYEHIKRVLPEFTEHTTDGSDYALEGILIEDKNSFSASNGWVGNGFNKTPVHLLKKFEVDADGRITKAFIALVDLSKTQGAWSDRQINTNRSVIQFMNEDIDNILLVTGSIRPAKKYAKPIMESV